MPEDALRAFGQDRLEEGEGGEVWLVCPLPKAWLPRRERTLTTAEYPGTAVAWHGGVFEVLRAEPQADGAIRYRLGPWSEGHAIRRMEQYDEASETARGAEQDDRRESIRHRRLSILLAPLAGLLPGDVQSAMESEFGAPALAMTISSALPLAVIGLLGLFEHLLGSFGAGLGLPAVLTPPLPLAMYLAIESALRLGSAIATREPMGSLPVVLAYAAWNEAREPDRAGPGLASALPDAGRDAQDRFRMLEPTLSLLAAEEQERIARQFPFDFVRWGKITAGILLFAGGGNALVSVVDLAVGRFGATEAVWLVVGGLLALEQIWRWRRLASGQPAGSVLGVLVRPLAKPLLARPESKLD